MQIPQDSLLLNFENVHLCLVGKLLSSKRVNTEAFRSVMRSLWKVHFSTRIDYVGDNLFVCQFRSIMEKQRILSSSPWVFDNSLLVLNLPKVNAQVSDLTFTHAPFWVLIHNVPINGLTVAMAKLLGSRIDEVEAVDEEEGGQGLGPVMRVRVLVGLSSPLRRGVTLRIGEGEERWCPVTYEWLPGFCFGCGRIGHSRRECTVPVSASSEDRADQYGPWLRALGFRLVQRSKRLDSEMEKAAATSPKVDFGVGLLTAVAPTKVTILVKVGDAGLTAGGDWGSISDGCGEGECGPSFSAE